MAFRNGGAVATVDVTFAGSLVLTGMLIEWAVATPPGGFLLCDGTTVSRATYADLFALWGTTFGAGDGSTTFGLPDYRGRVSVHPDGGAGRLSAAGAVGATGGQATHTLSAAQLAAHTHPLTDPGHAHVLSDPGHNHGPVNGLLYHSGAGPFTSGRHSAQGNAGAGILTIASSAAVTDLATTGQTVNVQTTGASVAANAGGGSAHPNDQPWLAVYKMVKT